MPQSGRNPSKGRKTHRTPTRDTRKSNAQRQGPEGQSEIPETGYHPNGHGFASPHFSGDPEPIRNGPEHPGRVDGDGDNAWTELGPDPFDVLGVNPEATLAQIKQAYHALCLRFHPDTAADTTPDCLLRFQLIQDAYRTLSNPHTRVHWHRRSSKVERMEGLAAPGSTDPGLGLGSALSRWARRAAAEGDTFTTLSKLAFAILFAIVLALAFLPSDTNRLSQPFSSSSQPQPKSMGQGSSSTSENVIPESVRERNVSGIPETNHQHQEWRAETRKFSSAPVPPNADLDPSGFPQTPSASIAAEHLREKSDSRAPPARRNPDMPAQVKAEESSPEIPPGTADRWRGQWMASCQLTTIGDVFIGWMNIGENATFHWRGAASGASGTDPVYALESQRSPDGTLLLLSPSANAGQRARIWRSGNGSVQLEWLAALGRPADVCRMWTLFPSNRLPAQEGLWLLPDRHETLEGAFAPEYVELVLQRKDDSLGGRFAGRYRVPSPSAGRHALGNSVQFQFQAEPDSPGWYRWEDPIGGEGILAIAPLGESRLATYWKRTRLQQGRPQLTSGFAVLLRAD